MVFVLTDGRSNRGISPGIPAGQLKNAGVIIYAMGVTNNIRDSELQAIASTRDNKKLVFHVANYAALNDVTQLFEGGKLMSVTSETQIIRLLRRAKSTIKMADNLLQNVSQQFFRSW